MIDDKLICEKNFPLRRSDGIFLTFDLNEKIEFNRFFVLTYRTEGSIFPK